MHETISLPEDASQIDEGQIQSDVQVTPPARYQGEHLTWREQVVLWLRSRSLEQWGYVAIFVIATYLRFWDLGAKPVHHDESLHAYFSLQFMINPSGYLYDPLLHGPFQFHVIPFFYALGRILGLPGQGANDFTVRILPALLGLFMVPLSYLLRHQLGRWGAFAMAVLLTFSPSFVYYSRFVRDDIYVAFFTLLIVAAAVQYGRTQQARWIYLLVASLTLSFTAMENTYFTVAVFGSFLVAVLLWDLGPIVGRAFGSYFAEPDQPLAGRIVLMSPFAGIVMIAAFFGLRALGVLSTTINALAARHTSQFDPLNPDVTVQQYEAWAVAIFIYLTIAVLMATAVPIIIRIIRYEPIFAQTRPNRLTSRIDRVGQPVLYSVLSIRWLQWACAFFVGWVLFVVFFWKLPSNPLSVAQWGQGFQQGIGRGLLQGLYYWLEQQHVARGGQPWYYYLILLPLYEPLILIFGIAGLIRSLIQPTRFRVFVVWWFIFNLALYSWAGEKMPWLIVHILLPLTILAGIALDWVLLHALRGAREWWNPTKLLAGAGIVMMAVAFASLSAANAMGITLAAAIAAIVGIVAAAGLEVLVHQRKMQFIAAPGWLNPLRTMIASTSALLAVVLLIPMIWNMRQVAFVEPSVAPNEMLVYVQTTTDVTDTMKKIDTLDAALNHGQHLHNISIGVSHNAPWPFVWYLHDYINVIYDYKATPGGTQPDVIIGAQDDGSFQSVPSTFPNAYVYKQMPMRWWWDESYKLPVCTSTKTTQCSSQDLWPTSDGPLLWLSYGTNPPQPTLAICTDPNQKAKNPACNPLNDAFNPASAASRYWNWLWLRQNISGVKTSGSYDFMFFVRSDLTHIVQP